MVWRLDDPCGNEAAKVKYDVVPYTRGRGLDLGCGPSKAFPHFIGVDSGKDTALFGIAMKPDVACDITDLSLFGEASMDFVFSSHALEHIEDYKGALEQWWRVIKVGGHLVLYLPHRDFYPRIGTPGANPDHKHDFAPEDITAALVELKADADLLVREERNERNEYSFLLVARKLTAGEGWRESWRTPKPAKSACVCRFGGFGDQLQAANILPVLKRQGYHVTFMTTPNGRNVLEHDPHIDAWIVQDPDQVPNNELSAYWEASARRFDKFVNLSESVEGTLLAMPGRANHAWPHKVRHALLDRNYLEFTSQLAELPYSNEAKFYASADEREQMGKYLHDRGGDDAFHILWVLAGSSVHKMYPGMDSVVARVMLELPEAQVIFVGDEACKILEAGWEAEPRVHLESGEMSIRNTLALAQQVDCVVGPETGVLNAVAFEDVSKVIFLSHSSRQNLTLHWKNVINLSASPDPSIKPCGLLPCHQLHYGNRHCPTDEASGAAMCQVAIDPQSVFAAIRHAHRAWKAKVGKAKHRLDRPAVRQMASATA